MKLFNYKHLSSLLLLMLLLASASSSAQDTLRFVFLNTNPDRAMLPDDEVSQLQQRHLANIDRLYHKGKILAAGPFNDGGGFFIMKGANSIELDSLLKSDPAIRADRFLLETLPLTLLHGSLCKPIEPFVLDSVTFLRIDRTETNQAISINTIPETVLKQSHALIIGAWNNQGGFIVGRSTDKQFSKWITTFTATKKNLYNMKRRTLWYGLGTFCEE